MNHASISPARMPCPEPALLTGPSLLERPDDLRRWAELQQALLTGFPLPVLVANTAFRIVHANTQCLELFGYAHGELWQAPVEQVIPEGIPLSGAGIVGRVQPFRPNVAGRHPGLGRTKHGQEFALELDLSLVPYEGQSYTIAVIHAQAAAVEEEAADEAGFLGLVGESQPMRELQGLIRRLAGCDTTVLILGESGTGKELVARAIHRLSPRRAQPLVAIDCGALPEPLLESELFGHVKGAFTGAIRSKRGLFQEAERGTLFLDEVTNTSLAIQAKLLRALQEHEIRPVGGNQSFAVNVRVLVASNKSLEQAVLEQRFREDLCFRLSALPLQLPPLRQRLEDLPMLAEHFIRRHCAHNRLPPKQLSPAALDFLHQQAWPGNVRELEHVLERGVLLSRGPRIEPADFVMQKSTPLVEPVNGNYAREKEAQRVLQEALQATGQNRTAAARLLRISRSTLYNRLRRLHLGGPT
ncbi:MAG: sigma 54-interacting transcriptional regulator [Gammaproteobacteria bacterium]|nr:sigma 54-interacting transcriptional regulator [Gammaproteobacteria bacterium]